MGGETDVASYSLFFGLDECFRSTAGTHDLFRFLCRFHGMELIQIEVIRLKSFNEPSSWERAPWASRFSALHARKTFLRYG